MQSTLSSDILERQCGPTKFEVLHQDAAVRIICTRTVKSSAMLELSRVTFTPAGSTAFADVHKNVLAGQSMGKAFRACGIEFTRRTTAAYSYCVPWFAGDQPATVVAVTILVGPQKIPYATILETYSPSIKWPEQKGEPTPNQLRDLELLADFWKVNRGY